MRKLLLLSLFILIVNSLLLANNVQVKNVEVVRIDRTNKIIYIQFDLSGENSWRIRGGAANWDANWVFVKYRSGSGAWSHATLSTDRSVYLFPSEISVDPATDGKGVFIYSAISDIGLIPNYNYQDIVLAWNYGIDGFNDTSTDLEIKVFAIEMVYIPQGDYYLGDGSSLGTFRNSSSNPALISNNPLSVYCENTSYDDAQLETLGVLVDGDGGIDSDGDNIIDNTTFPTGYNAFYCMKYEISQQQYVDFLNNISAADAGVRGDLTNSDRNNITASSNYPDISTTRPYVALNWIDWYDLVAYLDWAGLRPMTELEFEKAARGSSNPVAGEFAWGTSNAATGVYNIINQDSSNEEVSNPSTVAGNVNYLNTSPSGSLSGPMRCGIFAANNSSNSREFAGASYYGVMDLSGNLWEMVVTLGDAEGRLFRGTHGDGKLVNSGADNSDWPNNGTGQALGIGFKGGGYTHSEIQISDRTYAAVGYYPRDNNQGGRGVRTAN
jgi:formylglycine-generating enzyme required for sulfatase activity